MNDLTLFLLIALLLFGSGMLTGWYVARKHYKKRVEVFDRIHEEREEMIKGIFEKEEPENTPCS